MKTLILLAIAAAAFLTHAASAEPSLKPVFAITLDIDRDGKSDRAVLIAREGAGFYAANNEWFTIGADGRVDLHVYLAAGDDNLDPPRQPAVLKKGIVVGERANQVFPLKARNGSLILKTAYSLHSNYAEETLTIVHRNGEFLVAGLTYSFERKDGEQGSCDVNFLTGRGVVSKGPGGTKRPVRERLRPVPLSAWSGKSYPRACRS